MHNVGGYYVIGWGVVVNWFLRFSFGEVTVKFVWCEFSVWSENIENMMQVPYISASINYM